MQLFEFIISKDTDIEAFHNFMRKKYPDIIGRKRFCCHVEEATKELREDCWGFRVTLQPDCKCLRCLHEQQQRDVAAGVYAEDDMLRYFPIESIRMIVCGTCGNKRCPHSDWHENPCTGSNNAGQPGSRYGN